MQATCTPTCFHQYQTCSGIRLYTQRTFYRGRYKRVYTWQHFAPPPSAPLSTCSPSFALAGGKKSIPADTRRKWRNSVRRHTQLSSLKLGKLKHLFPLALYHSANYVWTCPAPPSQLLTPYFKLLAVTILAHIHLTLCLHTLNKLRKYLHNQASLT
jgi:hypothetical protein